MALYPFVASTDFAGKGKMLGSWMLQSTAGTIVTFKSGGTGGTTLFKVQLAANSSQHGEYSHGHVPVAVGSWYVDIGAGDCTGCVDLV
jgi:hypothetical protein